MRIIHQISFVLAVLFFTSCNQEAEVKADKSDRLTVTPRKNTTELEAMLPSKLGDHIAPSKAVGLDMNLQNTAFSFITQKYVKDQDTIYVELHDYRDDKSAYDQYSKMWWASDDAVNNEMKVSKYISFGPAVDAWEVWEREDKKRSAIYVGIRNRYYMIFECFGRNNSDFIREIAAKFDYSKL